MNKIAHIPKTFIAACAAAALAVAVCMYFVPGVPPMAFFGFAGITAAALAVYGFLCGGASRLGAYVLLGAATLLSIGIVVNVNYFTIGSGGTDAAPVLYNSDAWRTWNDALFHLDAGGEAIPPTYGMYGGIIAVVMSLTGISVTAGLMVSMAATLMSILCSGIIAWRLIADRRIAAVSMACCAAVCYFLTSGTLLIKDAWVCASFAIVGVGFASSGDGSCRRIVLPVYIGAVMLLLVRPNMLLAMAIGTVMCILPAAVDAEGRRKAWTYIGLCAGFCILLWGVGNIAQITPDAGGIINIGMSNEWIRYDAPNQLAYYNIIGDYSDLPVYYKVMMLPVTAAVQFLIPFPWNWGRDIIYGPTSFYAHIAYPWYLFGLMAFYYLFYGRHEYDMTVPYFRMKTVTRLVLWSLVCWLIPCYLFGGTISRYGLMAVPTVAPAVALAVLGPKYSIRTWMSWAGVALLVVLVSCYIMQSITFPPTE